MSRDLDRGRDRDRDRSRSRDRNSDPDASSSLLVRNLSYNITSSDIRRLMEKYGEIRDVYIPTDYHTRRPRGFAFVEFFDHRDARSALQSLDRYLLDGRELGVVFAKDKRKTPGEMRQIDRPRSRDRGDRNRGGSHRDRDSSRDRDRGRDRDRDSRRKRSPSPKRRSSPSRSPSRSKSASSSRSRSRDRGAKSARSSSPGARKSSHSDSD